MSFRPGGNGQNPGGNDARPGAGAPPFGRGPAGGARPGAGGSPPGGFGPGGRRPGGGGPGMMGMMTMPVQKPGNFRVSFRRLLQRLAPERMLVALVVVLAVVSVAFAIVGPKILGNATNDIFNGYISSILPAGVS